MNLLTVATEHVTRYRLARTLVHSVNRWLRFGGPALANELTTESIAAFRKAAADAGLSPWTAEKTITDVLTAAKFCGVAVDRGRRVRKPNPTPDPAPIETIEAIWPHLAPWSRQLLALAYWTGLRLTDACGAHLHGDFSRDHFRWSANKTGKDHVWPLPAWLRQMMADRSGIPYRAANDHAQVIIRAEFERACKLAKVPRLLPIQLRQRAVTEWTRANAKAGEILHGCGLGVLRHYIEPLSILESAAPRVRLPACFGASSDVSNEDALLSNFRRLDPAGQGLVTMTLERLAAS